MSGLFQDLLDSTAARLSPVSDTPQLDAQVLLANVFNTTRTWILSHSTSQPNAAGAHVLEPLIRRLEAGEPLPYVLGHQEFFGLDFDLTPDVLIPRPETELLVEKALAWLEAAPERRTVADVGTGSGCIAVSLATRLPDLRVLATDISVAALRVAQGNAAKFKVSERIDFVGCDILPEHISGLPTDLHFDLVCANLPYIPSAQLHALAVFRHEPALALDGGPDGLDPFRRLFDLIPDWMAPAGHILLEIESSSGPAVLSLAYDTLHAAKIHLQQDLTGQDRLLEIQLPAA